MSIRETELALALYRDDDLLKSVLSSVELPAQAERVAVSLGDPVLGPFVILTRTGKFVTCLARGMRVDGLPVISRERFDIAGGRVQRMRDELERLRQLQESGADGEIARLSRTLLASGPRFYREDAALLGRVQPLLAGALVPHVVDLMKTVLVELLPMLGRLRFDKLKPKESELLLMCFGFSWTVAHLVPFLASAEARQVCAKLGDKRGMGEIMPVSMAFELGTFAHAHRALWAAARMSSSSLSTIRHLPKHGDRLSQRLFRELSLGAIACASPSRRAEATKAIFRGGEGLDPGLGVGPSIDPFVGRIGRLIEDVLNAPGEAIARHTELGRVNVLHVFELYPNEKTRAIKDIPDDIARSALAGTPATWHLPETRRLVPVFAHALPWLVQCPVEALFLPRQWADMILPAHDVIQAANWLMTLANHLGISRASTVVNEGPRAGRNDPCPCGSGVKAKRCCMRADAQV